MSESKTARSMVFILVTMVCLSSMAWAGKDAYGKPDWQESTGSRGGKVQLGVRDKNDTHPAYKAIFLVSGPDGQHYQAVRQVVLTQDSWGFVFFPSDFNPVLKKLTPGVYSWRCVVKGETIFHGSQFEYHPTTGFIVNRK